MTRSHHQWPAASDLGSQRTTLSLTFVGRLVFPICQGPRSIVVECHGTHDGFTLHLPELNEAAGYLDDTALTLTSIGAESTHSAEVITGRDRLRADRDVNVGTTEALERWSDGTPAHYFRTPTRPWTRAQGQDHKRRRGMHDDPPVRRDQPASTS